MSARDEIRRDLTMPKVRGVHCSPDGADALLDAYRAEVLREGADAVAENLRDTPEYGQYIADLLRGIADAGQAGKVTAPSGETTQPEPGTCDCMGSGPHSKLPCGHCAMDLCDDCKTCAACPHTCDEGGW